MLKADSCYEQTNIMNYGFLTNYTSANRCQLEISNTVTDEATKQQKVLSDPDGMHARNTCAQRSASF